MGLASGHREEGTHSEGTRVKSFAVPNSALASDPRPGHPVQPRCLCTATCPLHGQRLGGAAILFLAGLEVVACAHAHAFTSDFTAITMALGGENLKPDQPA